MRTRSPGLVVQAFAADAQPNPSALELLAAQTLRAREGGATLAEKPELDMLLRLAGTRQISEALERAGYKAKGKRLFLLAASARRADLHKFGADVDEDKRFRRIARRPLTREDMRAVERAALLAARL